MRVRLTHANAASLIHPRRTGPPKVKTHVPGFIMPGIDDCALEPHIDFDFFHRYRTEITLRDPEQPFPEDLLPDEEPIAAATPNEGQARAVPKSKKVRAQEQARADAKRAAEREARYCRVQGLLAKDRAVMDAGSRSASAIRVAQGGAIDPSLIEDRDYDYEEVVGTDSRFRLRLIPWGGAMPRPVVCNKSVVLILGGRARNVDWKTQIIDPVTEACDLAKQSVPQSPEDIAAGKPSVLSGGVGITFNELKTDAPQFASVLNTLVFIQLFTTETNSCAYSSRPPSGPLKPRSSSSSSTTPMLSTRRTSSVFSAATFEFGPHLQETNRRHEAASWSVLLALGNYKHRHGGHVIFWDLGLAVAFPPGSCILIPSGLIRYSFVKVRPHETRYSLMQWAGAGIGRWFQNARCTDIEFAVKATREEHAAREGRRELDQDAALSSFPHESELELNAMQLKFYGETPDAETLNTIY
ncbi:hypothetical protein C8F04DRAFT_1264817 [Mycena alexandri]|uniref:Uncharacterized protein n=1 Tax=Mycena alexandri TaxID=1745969 RepID=A0AAD6SKC5_9AGAR|nr:hypothetical protein C8F04DRAFT_1264817 [Mycena alexandri]